MRAHSTTQANDLTGKMAGQLARSLFQGLSTEPRLWGTLLSSVGWCNLGEGLDCPVKRSARGLVERQAVPLLRLRPRACVAGIALILNTVCACDGESGDAVTDPDAEVRCREGALDLVAGTEADSSTFVALESLPFRQSGENVQSPAVELCVPPDTQSLAITIFGQALVSEGERYIFSMFRNPSNEALIDPQSGPTLLRSAVRQSQAPGLGIDFAAILYPQNPRTSATGGHYRFQSIASVATDKGVQIALRRGPRADTGVIPYNLIAVGRALDDRDERTRVFGALTASDEFFRQRGIRLAETGGGIARITDETFETVVIPSSAGEVPENVPARLFGAEATESTTLPLAENALNIYVVNELTLQPNPDSDIGPGISRNQVVLGVSAGAPGAYLERHGVIVALEAHRAGPRRTIEPQLLAGTLAHEVAHWLGLYHTSESTGTIHDRIEDTPECTRNFDTNGDGILTPEECAERGAGNFMFWTIDPNAAFLNQSEISVDQGAQLRLNPVVSRGQE